MLRDHWINAGFFVFDKKAFDYWRGTNLEREVLPRLGELRMLYAYKHKGFWKSMDTYKDHQELELIFREKGDACCRPQGSRLDDAAGKDWAEERVDHG